jgi:hypothetical protein
MTHPQSNFYSIWSLSRIPEFYCFPFNWVEHQQEPVMADFSACSVDNQNTVNFGE